MDFIKKFFTAQEPEKTIGLTSLGLAKKQLPSRKKNTVQMYAPLKFPVKKPSLLDY